MFLLPAIYLPAKAPLVAAIEGNAVSTTSQSSTTFSGVSFGAAAANRYLIATVGTDDPGSDPTSVTIGGVSATKLASASATAADISIWIALVPTGTSGSVVVNWGGTASRKAVSIINVTGLQSTTPADTASDGDGNSTGTLTIDCPAGGIIVGAAHWGTGSSNNVRHTNAFDIFSSAVSSRAVSVAMAATNATWTNLTEKTDISTGSTVNTGRFAACAVSLR